MLLVQVQDATDKKVAVVEGLVTAKEGEVLDV
jgi:hypothetical protein